MIVALRLLDSYSLLSLLWTNFPWLNCNDYKGKPTDIIYWTWIVAVVQQRQWGPLICCCFLLMKRLSCWLLLLSVVCCFFFTLFYLEGLVVSVKRSKFGALPSSLDLCSPREHSSNFWIYQQPFWRCSYCSCFVFLLIVSENIGKGSD